MISLSPLNGTPFSWADTTPGPELQYWVVFDQPQYDVDGDGPYVAGDVLAGYIEVLP